MLPTVRAELTVEIARTPEEVFAYLTDVSNLPHWQSGVHAATLEGLPAAGALIHESRHMLGRELHTSLEIEEYRTALKLAQKKAETPALREMVAEARSVRERILFAPEDTLGEAAQKMVERGVGSAVVMDFGRLIGILTERDLLRAVAARTHSSEARVREWMTAEPITADEDTNPADAARTMLENGFRHLPVISGDRAVGIVSIRDVAEWSMQHTDEG